MAFHLCEDFARQICSVVEKYLHLFDFKDVDGSFDSLASAFHNYNTAQRWVNEFSVDYLDKSPGYPVSLYIDSFANVSD